MFSSIVSSMRLSPLSVSCTSDWQAADMDGQGTFPKQCTSCSSNMGDDLLTEWYIETMEDFWSGHWEMSVAAFISVGMFYALLFGIPFF